VKGKKEVLKGRLKKRPKTVTTGKVKEGENGIKIRRKSRDREGGKAKKFDTSALTERGKAGSGGEDTKSRREKKRLRTC